MFEDTNLITALITAVVTVGLFIIKERIEAQRLKKQESKKTEGSFRAYTAPLQKAAISLYFRLKEIFEQKAKFLLDVAPSNNYYQYRYISTLYRLCIVLAWIRAVSRELSGMELENQKLYTDIKSSIESFQRALFEGRFVEEARLEYLCRKWELDIEVLKNENYEQVQEQIQQIIWDTLSSAEETYAYQLKDEDQMKLLKEVSDLLCSFSNTEVKSIEFLEKYKKSTIRALSRTESWIYRDWQNSIGDVMLKSANGNNSNRKFDTMGFEEFEDLFLELKENKDHKNRWVGRVDGLFHNLDMTSDEKFDARVQQLQNVASSLIILIKTLDRLNPEVLISNEIVLNDLMVFDQENNPEYYQES